MNTQTPTSKDTPAAPDGAAPSRAAVADRPLSPGTFDFWRSAHRALRGRYRLALWMAAGGAVAGACIGTAIGKRLYSATGLVRIASALPPVMHETDQNQPMAMFDGFIQAQRDVMISREVVQAAMKEESWRQVGKSRRTPSEAQFASSLKVETRPRSDHLRVTFVHSDPGVAAAAVQSVISAYQQVFTREQRSAEGSRMDLLHTRRDSLSAELQKVEGAINTVSRGHTLTEVEPLYLEASDRLRKLRSALTDVQIALAGGPDNTARQGGLDRSPSEIAESERVRAYAAEQARLELELLEARSRGLLPGHRTIERLEAAIQACRAQMAQYLDPAEDGGVAKTTDASPISLREREASLRALAQAAQEEMRQLAAERDQLKGLDEQAAGLRQQLADTNSRLDALTTEASLGGRLTIIRSGDRPMTALLDNRAKMAGAGAFAGMAAPLGLLILSTSVRRRYRSGEELAEDLAERVPFVAVLPEVGVSTALDAMAVRGVHDLRVRLQPAQGSAPRVYLVTGPSGGEGKTGLTAALGLSFAAAGFRTLLVDGDFSSRSLTLQFDAGESSGLIEALDGQEPVIQWARAGVSVLTAGRSHRLGAWKVAPAAVGRVLAALRNRFDVVLIDSDSILTGMTASLIAPHVDGVILTVAHGQDPRLVQQTTRQTDLLGVGLSTAVFNRADAADFRAVLKDQTALAQTSSRRLPGRLERFGPLVTSMLSSLSITREADFDLATSPIGPGRANDTADLSDGAYGKHQPRSQGRSAA